MKSVILAALLSGAAMAVPAPAPKNPYPVKVQDLFSLVAKVTKHSTSGPPLHVENYYFTSVHVAAGEDAAILIPRNGPNPLNVQKQTFVQNGTTSELEFHDGYVERYPPTPGQGIYGVYGINVFPSGQPNDAGPHSVSVDAGVGSPRTAIQFPETGIAFPEDQPQLVFHNSTVPQYTSQFFACSGTLYGKTVPQVFWRSENGTTPANCSEITLFAQCEGNATAANAAVYHNLQKTPCYPNAAAIPVVTYG